MPITLGDTPMFSALSTVKVKKHDIRKVPSWPVGVQKSTLIKFTLPFDADSERLMPHELRKGLDRHQGIEQQRHVEFARALGKNEKTVSDRIAGRVVDTADAKMETPKEGSVRATHFWPYLESESMIFVDGEWFKYIRNDGSLVLVVELRFAHRSRVEMVIEALRASGVTPTKFSFNLRERLLKNFFRRSWHRCYAYSNSAHLDPTKTYNFTGKGRPGKTLFELDIQNGRVLFQKALE